MLSNVDNVSIYFEMVGELSVSYVLMHYSFVPVSFVSVCMDQFVQTTTLPTAINPQVTRPTYLWKHLPVLCAY